MPAGARTLTVIAPTDGGRIGQGVYTWSRYIYSNDWQFGAYWGDVNYTAHIQKTDGTNVVAVSYYDKLTEDIQLGSANDYRWGAQNHSTTPQSWWWCEYVE